MSYHDHIADFIAFMSSNGVEPAENIAGQLASGAMVRFDCRGDKKGRKSGWAILYLDERPAGAFGNWKENTGTLKWKANDDGPALSAEEREALQREWREKKAEREQQRIETQRATSLDAAEIWQRSTPAKRDHPYLKAKSVKPYGLRQDGNKLLVPMYDVDGTLWNLQRIAPDGAKLFLEGGRIDGLFCLIGQIEQADTQAVICEGYATGDAIRQSTPVPVIVAFNTANLPKVARIMAQQRPDLDWIIYADDDHATALKRVEEGKDYYNPGIEVAEAVARENGMRVAYPTSYRQRERAA